MVLFDSKSRLFALVCSVLVFGCAGGPRRANSSGGASSACPARSAASDAARALTLEPLFSIPGLDRELHFGDVDGDGATDIVYLDAEQRLHVRKSIVRDGRPDLERVDSEPPLFLTTEGGLPGASLRIALRDFNGDGRADVLAIGEAGYVLWVRTGSGDGFVQRTPAFAEGSPRDGQAASLLGDFDGDGAIDLAELDARQGRIRFWRLSADERFDRLQGQKWDITLDLPWPRRVAGAAQVGRFVPNGGSKSEQIVLPISDGAGVTTIALLGVETPARAPPSASTPTAGHGKLIQPSWARAELASGEFLSADLDGDGFSDLVHVASAGALQVFRGGSDSTASSSELGLAQDELRCVGSPKSALAFARLDDDNVLDLLRMPAGSGVIDAWLGEAGCGSKGAIPNFGPVRALRLVQRAPRQVTAFRAKTGAQPRTTARDELALVQDDTLTVYRSVPAAAPEPDAAWELKLRAGFERFLARDRVSNPDQSYSSEAPVIELSAWRYLHGRRTAPAESLSDAACFRAIADGYRVRDRLASYSGAEHWLASTRMDLSQPSAADPHDPEHSNWDPQSRLVIDFLTLYRVLHNRDFLRAADASAVRFLKTFERRAIDDTDCGGAPCRSFVIEPGGGMLRADPNQNLEIALAFALLLNTPGSNFHAAPIYARTRPDGASEPIDLRDVIAEEVRVAFSAQRSSDAASAAEREAQDGGLLISTSACYVARGAFDTRYGAYAVQSAIWLERELGQEPWFRSRVLEFLEPRLTRAADWLRRWSLPSAGRAEPKSYRCNFSCGDCNVEPLIEWDACARFPALQLLSEKGGKVCPSTLTLAPWLYPAHGFQALIHNELMGVPPDFYGKACD